MNTAAVKATIGRGSRKNSRKKHKRKSKKKKKSRVRFDLDNTQKYSFSLTSPNKKKKSRSTWYYFLITAYIIGWSAVWVSLYIVLMPYQVQLLFGENKKGSTLAFIIAIGGADSVIVPPLAGYLSDRTATRYGRRKPYILFGTIGCSIGIVMLGYCTNKIILSICWVLLTTCSNFGSTSFYALLPDVVPEEEMGKSSGIIAANSAIGQMIGASIGLYLNAPNTVNKISPHDKMSRLQTAYIILAIIHIACMAITVILVEEDIEGIMSSSLKRRNSIANESLLHQRNNNNDGGGDDDDIGYSSLEDPLTQNQNTSSNSIFSSCYGTGKNIYLEILRPFKSTTFFWIYVTRFLIQMGLYSVQEMYFYFIQDVVHTYNPIMPSTTMTSILLGLLTFVGGISGFGCGIVSDQWGGVRKIFVYIGGCLMMFACNMLMFVESFLWVSVASLLFGLGTEVLVERPRR